ncbi:MAG: hypothetical protein KY410_01800, partial [Proteobacteria bacterium]|nr:hypothetical protein [Pseudomonadota bacterium]
LEGIPLAILAGRSHSGDRMGILRSIRDDAKSHPTVDAIFACLEVRSAREYRAQGRAFDEQNQSVLEEQRVETRDLPGPFDRTRIKDPCSQVIFRVGDHEGHAVKDFELLLTADGDSPDRLPPGFFVDRQQNHRQPANLTYYLNAARLLGAAPVAHAGEILREALMPAEGLGLCIKPYPVEGFVHYLPGRLRVSREVLQQVIVPHQTTVVDIELHRVVREGTYRLTRKQGAEDFTKAKPGPVIDGG